MTRAEINAAIKKGHTHAITIDRLNGDQILVSTHKTYEDARKRLMNGKSKGNTIHVLERLRRSIK